MAQDGTNMGYFVSPHILYMHMIEPGWTFETCARELIVKYTPGSAARPEQAMSQALDMMVQNFKAGTASGKTK
eukprot:11861974-Karenia_brevis.AAC.1